MDRRDVLKMLASSALPTLSGDTLFLLQGVHAQIARGSALRTLNPHQDATVTTIAELIIPQTETPGAKAVKVNEFIDLMLSDWYDSPDTSVFLAGLDGMDRRSQKSYGHKFVDCSEADQKKLLTALDEETLEARHKDPRAIPSSLTTFFGTMKRLTLVGYYTSEAGFKDELHRTILPPTHKGCAVIKGSA